MKLTTASNVADYIAGFPENTQLLLQQLRETIKRAAPDAQESISYQMPAYKFHGPLVYFAGYEKHIGFYPGSEGVAAFKSALETFENFKGTIQFPLDQPLPSDLIRRIVTFRVNKNLKKAELKVKNKK